MAFGSGDWKQLILEAVELIADRSYQERSWFRPTPDSLPVEISSPDEQINRLYSDLDFEEFMNSDAIRMSNYQHEAGLALKSALDDFIRDSPEFLDPMDTLMDPRWRRIRDLASAFAAKLKQK